METHLGKGTYKFLFIYEFFGVAMLIFSLNVSETQPIGNIPTHAGSPWAVAFTVMAAAFVCAPITGAHFNPAISTGVLISNREIIEQIPVFLLTIAGEISGALFGILLSFTCTQNQYTANNQTYGRVPKSELVILKPKTGITVWNAFTIEVICTFMLVFIVLITKTARLAPSKEGILAIMGTAFILFALIMVAQYSGACLNPAIGLAQAFYAWTQHDAVDGYLVIMYVLAPFTGGVLAGFAHRGHLRIHKRMNIKELFEGEIKVYEPKDDDVIYYENPEFQMTSSPLIPSLSSSGQLLNNSKSSGSIRQSAFSSVGKPSGELLKD